MIKIICQIKYLNHYYIFQSNSVYKCWKVREPKERMDKGETVFQPWVCFQADICDCEQIYNGLQEEFHLFSSFLEWNIEFPHIVVRVFF